MYVHHLNSMNDAFLMRALVTQNGMPLLQSPRPPIAGTPVFENQQLARLSPLEHPDLNVDDPVLTFMVGHHESRHNHCRKRKQHHHRKHTKARSQAREILILYCAVSGLLLGALLSTCTYNLYCDPS